MPALYLHVAASPSPRFAGEGQDGGQRADDVVCPPPRSSEVRGRLPPTSILPHTWGRKMLPYASIEAACGSVSFPRFTGEGRDGGQRADEVVCPPPRSSPIHGGGRCCFMPALYLHVAASPSPASRGKAGMGDSALRTQRVPSPSIRWVHHQLPRCTAIG